jgi:hypothetical protein
MFDAALNHYSTMRSALVFASVDWGIGMVTRFGPVTSICESSLITMTYVSRVKWISLMRTCSFSLAPPK